MGTFVLLLREYKLVQTLWKTGGGFLKKSKLEVPYVL